MRVQTGKYFQITGAVISLSLVAGVFAPSFVLADQPFWPPSKRLLGALDLTPDPPSDGDEDGGNPSDGDKGDDGKGGVNKGDDGIGGIGVAEGDFQSGISLDGEVSGSSQSYSSLIQPASPIASLFKFAGFTPIAEPIIKSSACSTYSGMYLLGMLGDDQLERDFEETQAGTRRPNPNRRSAATTAATLMSNGCPAAASFVKYQDPFLDTQLRPNRYRRIASIAELGGTGAVRTRRISPFRPDAPDGPPAQMAFLERVQRLDIPGQPPSVYSYPASMNLTIPSSFSVPENYLSGSTLPMAISPNLDVYGGQIYNFRNPTGVFTAITQTQAFWWTPGTSSQGFNDLSNAQFVHLGVIPPNRTSEDCGEFSFAYGSTETGSGRNVYGFGSLTTASVVPPRGGTVRSDRCVAGTRRDLSFPSMTSVLTPTDISVEIVHASIDGRFKLATEFNGSDLATRSYVIENGRQVSLSGGVNNPRVQAEKIIMTGSSQYRVWGHRDLQNPDYSGSEAVGWSESGNIVTVIGPNLEGRAEAVPDNDNYYISSTEVRSAARQGSKDIVVGMARVTDVVENNVQRGSFRAGYSCGVINEETYPNTFDYEYLPGTPREAFYWETGMAAPKSLKAYALSQLTGTDTKTTAARAALQSMTLCEAIDIATNATTKVIVGRAISQGRLTGFMLVLNSERISAEQYKLDTFRLTPRI